MTDGQEGSDFWHGQPFSNRTSAGGVQGPRGWQGCVLAPVLWVGYVFLAMVQGEQLWERCMLGGHQGGL